MYVDFYSDLECSDFVFGKRFPNVYSRMCVIVRLWTLKQERLQLRKIFTEQIQKYWLHAPYIVISRVISDASQ